MSFREVPTRVCDHQIRPRYIVHGGDRLITPFYSVLKNSISPLFSRQGSWGFASFSSQVARALAFISRSTSA